LAIINAWKEGDLRSKSSLGLETGESKKEGDLRSTSSLGQETGENKK